MVYRRRPKTCHSRVNAINQTYLRLSNVGLTNIYTLRVYKLLIRISCIQAHRLVTGTCSFSCDLLPIFCLSIPHNCCSLGTVYKPVSTSSSPHHGGLRKSDQSLQQTSYRVRGSWVCGELTDGQTTTILDYGWIKLTPLRPTDIAPPLSPAPSASPAGTHTSIFPLRANPATLQPQPIRSQPPMVSSALEAPWERCSLCGHVMPLAAKLTSSWDRFSPCLEVLSKGVRSIYSTSNLSSLLNMSKHNMSYPLC